MTAKSPRSVLHLVDIVSRGITSKIDSQYVPVLKFLEHNAVLTETLGRWALYSAESNGELVERSPQREDIVVCESALQLVAHEHSGSHSVELYSIEVTAAAIYRLSANADENLVFAELSRRTCAHVRGFLRNRVLQELAGMRSPPVPFQSEWAKPKNRARKKRSPLGDQATSEAPSAPKM